MRLATVIAVTAGLLLTGCNHVSRLLHIDPKTGKIGRGFHDGPAPERSASQPTSEPVYGPGQESGSKPEAEPVTASND